MKENIIYCVVVKFDNGGEVMDSFERRDSAITRSQEIINHIQSNKAKNTTVYLSELEYDFYNNRITTNKLINNDSELLFNI